MMPYSRTPYRESTMPRLRRSQALAAAFSWLMALQLVAHGLLMLLPAGTGGNTLGVICSANGARNPGNAGIATDKLPPCCTSGNCCCLPGAAPLPPAPTIPRLAGPMHASVRPTFKQAHVQTSGWRWQARAPPFSV